MALTTVQTELIDAASPVNEYYSIGSRIRYMTTAGAIEAAGNWDFNSYESYVSINVASGATGSSDLTSTSAQMTPWGFWKLDSGGSSVVTRVSSDLTAGNRLTIFNPTTGTTMYVVFSTNGGITVHDTGDCIVPLQPQEVLDLLAVSTAKWVNMGSSGGFKSAFTTTT